MVGAPSDTPLARAIRAHLARSGETARSLSLRVGKNETLVRKILSGETKHARADTVAALAKIMQVSPAELAVGLSASQLVYGEPVLPAPDVQLPEPRPEGARDVPVYGVASCGTDGAFVMNMGDAPVDYLPRPAALVRASGIFAVFVQGSSMEPLFRHGEAVFCQDRRPYGANDAVLVQLEAARGDPPLAFIKVFMRSDDTRLVLRQLNPPEEMELERTEVRKIWRVLHPRELT